MNKKMMALIAFLAVCVIATAQKTDTAYHIRTAKTIYWEIGGPGIISANYDQRFKGNDGLGFRAGIGGIGYGLAGVLTVPAGLNYLKGSGGHYAEFGAGACFITAYNIFFNANSSSSIFGYMNFGYRYQPLKRGFTGRIFLCPLITKAGVFPLYGGISAGIRF